MASTVNNSAQKLVLQRGYPTLLGSVTATTQVEQFAIPTLEGGDPDGLDCLTIASAGGTGVTAIALEASINGGTNWFGITVRNSLLTTTTLNSDTAVTAVGTYDVSGLQGALFRASVAGLSAGTAVLTALYA